MESQENKNDEQKQQSKQDQEQKITFFTLEEVSKHNTADSLWVVFDGSVYDATEFHKKHPGGPHALLHVAGQDVTARVNAVPTHQKYWNSISEKHLPKMFIGKLVAK